MKNTIFALAAALGMSAPLPAAAQAVTIKGSDTMVILGQRWAEAYMKKHPDARLQVTGGGSGTGISALINGTTDICQSSRPMKDSEKEKLAARYSTPPVEVAVAKDGVTIYVHPSNSIRDISIDQLKGIFTGKITNWKELGGADAKIVILSRENSSGTYAFFKEEVLGGRDFSPRAQTLPGTAAVVNAVSKEKNGIGYGGAAYAKNIRLLPVKKDASSPAVPPSSEKIKSGEYPLARPLYFYLPKKPEGEIARFIEWVLGAEGQALAEKVGYFAVK